MAKIKYKCPSCEELSPIREIEHYEVTMSTEVGSIRIAGDSSSETFKNSYAEMNLVSKSEEEAEREFIRVVGYECSHCGEEICDDEGPITDETALARHLEKQGMLERDDTDSELSLEDK
jgi:hypothetical protein